VRDVEREVANLKDVVDDLDLVRELILSKLKFSFNGGDSAVETAEQRKAPYQATEGSDDAPKRGRGRPPGSKNKPKAPIAPAPDPEPLLPPETVVASIPDDDMPADGSIPGFLDRRADNLGGEVQ
jgi:hypothetical protein